MDKIIIKGLKLYAYHGVNPEEKAEGQMFVLDITCSVSLCVPCKTDCVDDTVSYAKILKTARAAFLADKFDLLEKAAESVAAAVLGQLAAVQAVTVCVKKPQAPIQADFDYVAVEINRERLSDATGETEE